MEEFLDFLNSKFYEPLESYNAHVLTVELSELDITINKEKYVLDCYLKALSIFEKNFLMDDKIIFVVNTYMYDNIIPRPRRIKSYLKNQKNKYLNSLEDDSLIGGWEKVFHYYLNCEFGEVNYKKLIFHLCQHEMGYGIKSMDDYYFIHLEKNVCFRMLDDRFIDIIFKTHEDKLKFLDDFPEFERFKEFIPE